MAMTSQWDQPMRFVALVAALLVFPFLAFAACEGQDWRAQLAPETMQEIRARLAHLPFHRGIAVVGSHTNALERGVAGCGLVLGCRQLIGRHVETGTLVMQGGGFVETGRLFRAVLTAKGQERPEARACLAFFAGASKHRAGGWDEP